MKNAADLLARYRTAVEQLTDAKATLRVLEERVRLLEDEFQGGSIATNQTAPRPAMPRRFEPVMNVLRKTMQPMRLTDIQREVGSLTGPGVRAQLVTLIDLGYAKQVDRGLYQAVD